MNVQTAKQHRCPVCRSVDVASTTYQREFHPHGKTVTVTLLTSRCASCEAEFTSAAQHEENLVRLKARKVEYDGLLLGEEIFALRRRYGITQQQAAKVFGKGKIAFSRYENEASYPDDSTTKLLKLAIQKPDVFKLLADDAGVDLPLWEARCEDERGAKVLWQIFDGVVDSTTRSQAQRELLASVVQASRDALGSTFHFESWNAEMVNSPPANDGCYASSGASYA